MIHGNKQKELPDKQDFYVNSPLYSKYVIGENGEHYYNLLNHQGTLDCLCIECNQNSVFKSKQKRFGAPSHKDLEGWNNSNTFYQRIYGCSRNNSHELIFIFRLAHNEIIKIGQHPSIADISKHGIKKYQKVLGPKFHNEFNKAIGLNAHGVGVGSFVYLRRIIENFLIKPAYDQAKLQTNWDDDLYRKSKVKKKINLLKTELPAFLVQNTGVYGVISKGIHDLNEEECLEYFPTLRAFLELTLHELETQREQELKKKEVEQNLRTIAKKVGNEK